MFNKITRGGSLPGLARVGEAGPRSPMTRPVSPKLSAVPHG
ncbi:hypothetical protein BW41_00295 [Sphingomonas sp. RIT328]|nr:hypothetical protein BW41_00295 [Sphingomonas sp. RIT328]